MVANNREKDVTTLRNHRDYLALKEEFRAQH
jgi:hypothetical protein